MSLVAAVIVSALALGYVAAHPSDYKRYLVAGPLAGLGVAVMHYLGMYSMRFGGEIALSVALLIAVDLTSA